MFKLPKSLQKLDRKKFFLVMGITLIRLPLALFFAWIYWVFDDGISKMWIGLIILILIELSDGLDGFLARKYKVVSEAGAMFDPYSDSLSRLIVYFTFAAHGMTLMFVPLVMAIRDVTVAYSRIILARRNVSVRALLSGKIKAVVQATGAFIFCLSPLITPFTGTILYPIVSWIVIAATAASCIEYLLKAYKSVLS
ncbi:MAG: CDP-alcohol phosphatidyltransferase family protein [bacterium]